VGEDRRSKETDGCPLTAAITVKVAATVKTATIAEATEMAAAVMMAEMVEADITNRKGGGSDGDGGGSIVEGTLVHK
jgi:hypothetical protein